MMKAFKILPLFCLLFFNCSGQNKQKKIEDSAVKPDENVTVHKEYDEYGNLKHYDSIYSYSYSSKGTLSDSLKLQFQKHFNNHSFFSDSFFDDFFGKDSSKGGFYPDNFFHNGFINQNTQIENMMKQMDSIQQLFFNQRSSPIIPAEPEKENEKKLKNMNQI